MKVGVKYNMGYKEGDKDAYNLLVCIGTQKAGTYWLYSILSKDERFVHAAKQFEIVKEVHYFDIKRSCGTIYFCSKIFKTL